MRGFRKNILWVLLLLCSTHQVLSQESDLFAHRRINLYDIHHMPNAKGTDHRDSIARNRIWRAEQPRLYEYLPGAEERKQAAMIVIPGGGYIKQAYETAGVSFAKWLNTMGITAFVLLHRLPNQTDMEDPSLAPVMDAQRAVRWVRAHAQDYGIDPQKIGVIGCSAGGHASACVNVVKEDLSRCGDELDTVDFHPNFAVLISPAVSLKVLGHNKDRWVGPDANIQKLMRCFPIDSLIDSRTAPMCLIHAADDRTVSPLNSLEMYGALLRAGVKQSTLHIFPHGGHSISLRDQPGSTAFWPQLVEAWIREIGMLTEKKN